jgi:hypothetical protein
MDRTKRLLEVGYFPSQLPPSFHTRDLATHYLQLHTAWCACQEQPKHGKKPPVAPYSRPELFSVARVGHQRRVTSLPNPVAQTFLAKSVGENWGAFLKHYRSSKLSASRPRFLREGNRAVTIPPMQFLYERKISKAAGFRYMLKTDLSRFFPTIYTHSVPWAFHTKAVAKKNQKPSARYFGNSLDQALRQGQDGQTIGLPIGPDTSHLIAEAIAIAIDCDLKKRLKAWPAGFRYVDDYYLFFETASAAEVALASLARALKEFELQINFEKTKTCTVIEITDDYWPHRLRSFEIAGAGRKQTSDIHHFFELAKELARSNADESVMLYALRRVSSTVVRRESWEAFEAHICHVALAYPNTLQTVARLLSTYAQVGYPLQRPRLSRFVNAVIEDHAPLGHHSEVAWSLWMCKELGLTLSDLNIERLSEVHSSVCALLLLDLDQSGKLARRVKTAYWKAFATADALHGDLWLLAYEAGVRGWGGFSDAHVIADCYFDPLRQRNVRFYSEDAILTPLFRVRLDALDQYGVATEAEFFDHPAIEDLDSFIDFEESNGGYDSGVSSVRSPDLDIAVVDF